jgi:ABC-type uncharacterized transport system substrate-binding protein
LAQSGQFDAPAFVRYRSNSGQAPSVTNGDVVTVRIEPIRRKRPSIDPTQAFFPKLGHSGRKLTVPDACASTGFRPHFQYDRLPELAADLVRRQVAVIVASGNASSIAAKAATSTIPIVFATGDDPVQLGLVASLNRPGGNVTGVSFFTGPLDAKRLELLRELVPKASTIAYLINPRGGDVAMREIQAAAATLGLEILVLSVGAERELDAAFAIIIKQRAGALVVGAGGFFISVRDRLVALAADHALPASYQGRELAEVGGLMSYGASQPEAYRQAGRYAGQILKGAKPSDLPVVLPTKFELLINLKTAKALGLAVSPSMLARAEEVIE